MALERCVFRTPTGDTPFLDLDTPLSGLRRTLFELRHKVRVNVHMHKLGELYHEPYQMWLELIQSDSQMGAFILQLSKGKQ